MNQNIENGKQNVASEPSLYLFPVPLSDGHLSNVLPEYNIRLIKDIRYFIVENVRSARRFLKKCCHDINIDGLTFFTLNRQTPVAEIPAMLQPMAQGHSIGVISEAGCPAIADPGADVVALAQKKHYNVVPLVGPSSILMSLMGSGFNGQSFAFNGYLPIEKSARAQKLRDLERRSMREDQTQIFIETPYRNNRLIADIIDTLSPQTLLCVASDITGASQSIKTLSVREWSKTNFNYDKTPAIFLICHA
ncbi:MAG: SAM-dependent methyltransferase [Muribaculaceae bacterium]|nr:SAM-dependent methyltransferase [Muribaculaceae bacterium]